jgi:exopolysaccharide production protein ExoZ
MLDQLVTQKKPAISGKQSSIAGLHYLRALATILVVAAHAFPATALSKYFGEGLLTSFFSIPAGEIDLFFIMSGFIMVATATDQAGAPRVSAVEFLKKRAARLIPMLWIAMIFYNFCIFAAFGRIELWNSLRTVTFWPVGEVAPGVAWTIRYEVFFYGLFSIFFLWKPQFKVAMCLWFASPLVLYLYSGIAVDDGTFISFVCSPLNIDFAVGVFLALAVRSWKSKQTIELPYQLLWLVLICAGLRLFVIYFDLQVRSLGMVCSIAPICIVAMLVAVRTKPQTISPLWMFLGDSSYSIFLLHAPIVSATLVFLKKIAPWLPSTVATLATIVIAVSCSCIVHVVLERRIAAFLARTVLR